MIGSNAWELSSSAQRVRVAVLSVESQAFKRLLGTLLSLSHDQVLLALLASFDV